jgi:CRP-like cAMP-binding protein
VSVLDDLRAAEQRVAERLKELAPAVAEYRELEAVAKRLGINTGEVSGPASRPRLGSNARGSSRTRAGGSRSAAKAARTPSRSKAAPSARRRPPVGGREAQLLALVRARPGLTVREAGEEFGVDPTSLYRVVHRLEQSGALRKNGRKLEVVGAASG